MAPTDDCRANKPNRRTLARSILKSTWFVCPSIPVIGSGGLRTAPRRGKNSGRFLAMPATRFLEIHDLLTLATVRVGLPGSSKEDVLRNLINLLEGHPSVRDIEEVRAAIFQRESMMSTGVGKELALPHAKTSGVTESVAAFAVTAEPIDYGSIDNEPVRLIFLLVGTEAAKSEHIKMLSRVSRLMNRDRFREQLLRASSPSDVIETFREGESDLLDG